MVAQSARTARLDAVLVQRGLAPSRARAQAAVMAGEVYVNGEPAAKPGTQIPADARVELRSRRPAFVSRGGRKLDHALTAFRLDPRGLRAADVGASTGGFTDCLLQRGSSRVYAIDVGTGQLDWSLRRDPRVVSLEERDVRDVTAADLGGPVDLAVVDVAFISLARVLPAVRGLVAPGAPVVALVKPQFEVGPKAAKRGVVRDAAVHLDVLRRVAAQAEEAGFSVLDVTYSPIAGPEGNLEYFLHLRAQSGASRPLDFGTVVTGAHAGVPRRGAPSPEARGR